MVYELHAEQFNSTFSGIVDRLPYLQSLGVNCLELMPVTSLALDFDWGYGPLHYFAPNEQWGGRDGFKMLVDACHRAGVAVILDVVFQHVDPSFAYAQVYTAASVASPMIGGSGDFGPEVDYGLQFSRDYVHAVTSHWLAEYHVDGFRYDEVTDMYTEPTGDPYAGFAYDVYNQSLLIPRFTPSGGVAAGEYSRVIQVPEALNRPQEVLGNTYSSATWQDNLLGKVEDMASNNCYVDDSFALLLDASFSGYPTTKTVHDINGRPVEMPVAPFQYLNSHDHSHLAQFPYGESGRDPNEPLADRAWWYKIQPFVVALYTSQGVPMLWEGQEVSDNWVLPASGDLRVHFRRNLHWEYFYDLEGSPFVRLHRILGGLRAAYPALAQPHVVLLQPAIPARRRHRGLLQVGPRSNMPWWCSTSPDSPVGQPAGPGSGHVPGDGRRRHPADAPTVFARLPTPANRFTITVPSNYGYVFVSPAPGPPAATG